MSLTLGATQTTRPLPAPQLPVQDRTNHCALVHATEPLDIAGADQLLERVLPAMRNCRCLVLDLQTVEFIDSSGVGVLLSLAQELEAAGKELRVVITPGSRVERTLTLLQLMRRLQAYPTLSEAWNLHRAE